MTPIEPGSVCSLRSYLTAELIPFAQEFSHLGFKPEILAEFVLVQASFQEEGQLVFPTFFLTDHLAELLNAVDGHNALKTGGAEYAEHAVYRVFKQCALLAAEKPWVVYVELRERGFDYGVFRTDQYPLGPTAFERLRSLRTSNLRAVGLNRLGRNFVEIRSNSGLSRYVNTGSDQDQSIAPTEAIRKFTSALVRDAEPQLTETLESFYYRLGFDILHARTGTLLAVIPHGRPWPSIFDDGVKIESPIQVRDEILQLLHGKDINESYQQLVGCAALIKAMAGMDGVTVFDSRGAVIGYNFFVQHQSLGSRMHDAMAGGSRRRAFEALCARLGEDLSAVVYKSADGALRVATSP